MAAHSHSAGSRGLYLSTIAMETLTLLPRPSPPLLRAQTSRLGMMYVSMARCPPQITMQGSRCCLLVPDWPAHGGVRPAHSSRGLRSEGLRRLRDVAVSDERSQLEGPVGGSSPSKTDLGDSPRAS